MYVCKDGHMAIRRAVQGKKGIGINRVVTYYFDISKCQICSMIDGCYKAEAKTKTYSVSIKSEPHSEQAAFQETEYFKNKAGENGTTSKVRTVS